VPITDDAVEISVADTGSGISQEVARQLFQPFFTTKVHGMGVGLSICRTIVEAHGGRIGMRPNPGGGTVFYFTLRAVTGEEFTNAR
jgi:two-component system sensor kinase FixL